jgi:hypothetical protein
VCTGGWGEKKGVVWVQIVGRAYSKFSCSHQFLKMRSAVVVVQCIRSVVWNSSCGISKRNGPCVVM